MVAAGSGRGASIPAAAVLRGPSALGGRYDNSIEHSRRSTEGARCSGSSRELRVGALGYPRAVPRPRIAPVLPGPDGDGSRSLLGTGATVVFAALAILGCGRGGPAGGAQPHGPIAASAAQVLPATEPQRKFLVARETSFRVGASWSPAQQLGDRRWSLGGTAWNPLPGGGVDILSGRRRVDLTLVDSASAARCSAIRARVDGLIASGWLEWVERDGRRGEVVLAKLSARDALSSTDGSPTFLLVPVVRADTAGTAPRILRFRGTGDVLRLERVECLDLTWRSADAPSGDSDAWRIEIDDEVRSGWLAGPGDRWIKELEWGGATAVTLAVGQVIGVPTEIEVELREGREAGTAIRESTSSIRRLRTAGTWQEIRFERRDPRHRRATLELRVAPDSSALVALATLDLELPRPETALDGIILISVDTLRADRMSLYGAPRRTTPRIDAWAERYGVVFEQAIAAAASTLPSHASMLTGRDVLDHGAVLGIPLSESERTIAERLSARGWRTAAITGGGYLHPSYRLDQGFQRYRAWPRRPGFNPDEIEEGVGAALRFLDGASTRPFFLFLHTYHVHYPYRAEEPYYSAWRGRTSNATLEILPATLDPVWSRMLSSRSATIQDETGTRVLEEGPENLLPDSYDSGIAAMDAAIGPLLDRIESLSRAGSRIGVILTSDHGESLGESGYLGHGYLFESNLRVPLVMSVPGEARPGRRIADQVRGVDVAATVLALAGEQVEGELAGRPLVRDGRVEPGSVPEEAWSYSAESRHGLSLRSGDRKLVLDDAVGNSTAARVRAFRLGVDVEESSIGTLESGVAGTMARRAMRYWSEAGGGSVVSLDAAGGSGWKGTAHGGGFTDEWLRVYPGAKAADAIAPDGADGVRLGIESEAALPLRWWQPAARSRVRFESDHGGAVAAWWVEFDAERGCRAVDEHLDPLGRLRVALRRRWRCSDEETGEPDPGVLEQLRALGYLQ